MTADMDPSATYAVVVGIERYDAGWTLDGAGRDALRAAEWLRAAGVPARQISLMIDALPANSEMIAQRAAAVGLEPRNAGREDVINVFTRELFATKGRHLVVFWSGHGVLDEEYRRALFTADARAGDRRVVQVDDLLKILQDKEMTGFHDQVLIIDACANFVETMKSPTRLTPATFPFGSRKADVRQFVLYAAAQGQIAMHNQGAKYGECSAAVLDALHPPEGPQWPPDMPAISRSVAAHFERLREAGYTRQTPVYLSRHTDWSGSESCQDYGGIPVSGESQQAAADAGITASQVRRLVSAFAGRSVEVPPETVVEAVRGGEVERLLADLAAEADDDDEKLAIAELCRLWQVQQRIAVPLMTFQGVSLQLLRIYYDVVPDRQLAPRLTDLDQVLEFLAEFGDGDESSPLLRFVARLEVLTGAEVPADWFELSQSGLRRLRAGEDVLTTLTSGCHLVIHFTAPHWPTELDGYLRGPDGEWSKHVVRCTADEQGARRAVNSLITWAHDSLAGEPSLALGFLVPRARFDDIPERWTYVDELSGEFPLEEEYPVVLHSSDRIRVPRARAWWRARLRQISDDLEHAEPEILWIHAPLDPKKITRAVRDTKAACVVFADVPGPLRGSLPIDPLVAAINPGAPYVIWLDEAPADWVSTYEQITKLVCNGHFDEIPERTWRVRQQDAGAAQRPAIRVLWDNQELLPEFGQLGGIEVGTI